MAFLEVLPTPHACSASGPLHLLALWSRKLFALIFAWLIFSLHSSLGLIVTSSEGLISLPFNLWPPLAYFIFLHYLLSYIYIFCLLVYGLFCPLEGKLYEGKEVVFFTTIFPMLRMVPGSS